MILIWKTITIEVSNLTHSTCSSNTFSKALRTSEQQHLLQMQIFRTEFHVRFFLRFCFFLHKIKYEMISLMEITQLYAAIDADILYNIFIVILNKFLFHYKSLLHFQNADNHKNCKCIYLNFFRKHELNTMCLLAK